MKISQEFVTKMEKGKRYIAEYKVNEEIKKIYVCFDGKKIMEFYSKYLVTFSRVNDVKFFEVYEINDEEVAKIYNISNLYESYFYLGNVLNYRGIDEI